jgi:prepilin-type N-terminal cleavage/methylation domain-containing protein
MNFSSKSAFTIIELLIAVVVIGILASLVTLNLAESRARARDAQRQESVRAYSAAMEQWKAANGTYFVHNKAAGDLPSCTGFFPASGYLMCTGDSAVGFQGGSGGGMTRKDRPDYTTASIAEALGESGFLTVIRLDPLDNAFNTATTNDDVHTDFILALCRPNASPASEPRQAQEYAIFTTMERPSTSSEPTAQAHCGGNTTQYGWDLLIAQ